MSLYDTLVAEVSCPRCGSSVAAECEVKLGACSQRRLRVGDEVTWRPRRIVKNGGGPPDGNLDGEGYCECPRCRRDFWVVVQVREDRIASVAPDPTRAGYIADGSEQDPA